jgi:Tfp pilus assembly protein PilV
MRREAFSLLEMILATAILAASAMVLSALIGLGSKYGNRAEERNMAVSQAESLLDEFLAQLGNDDRPIEERTGELPGSTPRGFRIRANPFHMKNANLSRIGDRADGHDAGLLMVTVELFEVAGSIPSEQVKPLVKLSRWIRQPHTARDSLSTGTSMGKTRDVVRSQRGAFP